jgi:hypothetical protein
LLGYIIMFETPLKMTAQLLRHYRSNEDGGTTPAPLPQ